MMGMMGMMLFLILFFQPGEVNFALGIAAEVPDADAASVRGAYLVFGVIPGSVALEEDVIEFFERS